MVMDDPKSLILICGDFNINPLIESAEYKDYVLSYSDLNIEYLKATEDEYNIMMQIFQNGNPETIIDLVKE